MIVTRERGRASEPVGRVSERPGMGPEPARRGSEPVRWGSEPAGRLGVGGWRFALTISLDSQQVVGVFLHRLLPLADERIASFRSEDGVEDGSGAARPPHRLRQLSRQVSDLGVSRFRGLVRRGQRVNLFPRRFMTSETAFAFHSDMTIILFAYCSDHFSF